MIIFSEVLDYVARINRVLTAPGGSLLLGGRSGVGRRTVLLLVAHSLQIEVFTPHILRTYELKHFRNDLKSVMQKVGVEGQELVLLLEDYQIINASFLEIINSLLSSGEVPGLFSPEELEPILSPLRDQMSEDGFRGSLLSYFCNRVKANLHIVFIMDTTADSFTPYCEANPALYTSCSFQSMESWSNESMLKVALMFLQASNIAGGVQDLPKGKLKDEDMRRPSGGDALIQGFVYIHKSCDTATPRNYITFLNTYKAVYTSRKDRMRSRQDHLQAGVSKLNDATAVVDMLKEKSAKQQLLLADKQSEADKALLGITISMQTVTEQKSEMETVKTQQSKERLTLKRRKMSIDTELSEVEPLIRDAKKAIGSIKHETLSEIRALRAPPDTIRDILEGVLRIMGVFDTSWGSMRSFLAQRGVKDDIQNFDARQLTPQIRESVQALLKKNSKSFEPAVAKRASIAAAPLAAWVMANVKYSRVLEKIQPLSDEQNALVANLDKSEKKLDKLRDMLTGLDKQVIDMRSRFEVLTTDATRLKIEVEKQGEIIAAAENLVGKLEGEHKRWSGQVIELTEELEQLPLRALLASGFITYLSQAPEDKRRSMLHDWMTSVGLDIFDLQSFLSTESAMLVWKSEGLPSDDLSMENALVILQGEQCPFLIDPSQRATEWLCTHLKESKLEVVSQHDSNFTTVLELSVRFGKTLVIQEVEGVEPLIYPLLRKDLVTQGPRFMVQLGDKVIDYNESFKLYLSTRNPIIEIAPDAASIITKVNFTITRAGLTAQLLALAIQSEKPKLEERKSELLKAEEELKVQLAELEDSLLQELAMAEGNILENKTLLESLNLTKNKSMTIKESLVESQQLQTSLDQERNSYLPLATYGSDLFFVITDLCKINNMYQFSLTSFLRLFEKALSNKQDSGNTALRIQMLTSFLLLLVYEYICYSLFKADNLMFALHLVHGMKPHLFLKNEWAVFIGQLGHDQGSLRRHESIQAMFPAWVGSRRCRAMFALKTHFPSLYESLDISNTAMWSNFAKSSQCEKNFPAEVNQKLTLFQQVLVVQALWPDHLQSSMEQFAIRALSLKILYPPSLNFKRLYSTDSLHTEPILVIISPGADPSLEIQELAESEVGKESFYQVAMGQGQADIAIQSLKNCASKGEWLCLKNVHLVTSWLPTLEKELNSINPHKSFRLWLTTESHPKFPAVLLQSCLKVTFEAPPGIKKNMTRTYDSWTEGYIAQGERAVLHSQALFALAWFHAVMQERRCHIPQGWSKFYEFTMTDMRAAASIIDRMFQGSSKQQFLLLLCMMYQCYQYDHRTFRVCVCVCECGVCVCVQ